MPKGDTTKAREVMLSKRSKYEDAYQFKVLNPQLSTQKLAEMFGVDRSGLHKYIKQKNDDDSTSGIHNAKNAVMDIKNGLDTLKNLQDSTNARDREVADKALKTLEEYYPQMKSVFANIQNRVLNALDREVEKMEITGELDLKGIAQTQTILKMVNDTNYFNQKTPLVAVQNNIQNNASGSAMSSNGNMLEDNSGDSEIKIVYEIVHSSIDDKEKAMQEDNQSTIIEGDIVD